MFNTKRPLIPNNKRKSKVIPNQCLSLSQTVQRLQSGNTFGVHRLNVEFDGEGNDIDVLDLDFSDPLTSRAAMAAAAADITHTWKDSTNPEILKNIPIVED